MSTPFYRPKNPDFLDTIGYTKRVVDAILRNNPLIDAVISEGLMKWIGNYTNAGNPDKINFLWIGEFNPADTNLPGNPKQRAISMVRDDSRGGVSAFAIFDPNPSGGGGLKQTIHIRSGDTDPLFLEARDGGWLWPEENVYMGPWGENIADWMGTVTNSPTWFPLHQGRFSVVGNQVAYTIAGGGEAGAAANYRVRVDDGGSGLVGPTHSIAAGTSAVFSGTVDVTSMRGTTTNIWMEAQRTNGVGTARGTVTTVRCFSP